MRVLFIHRSVGRDLIGQGSLRTLLRSKSIDLDDYDNNSGVLTRSDGSSLNGAISMPGNNTNPDNLAEFFKKWPEILDEYDLIMIKSCYPNSHIKDEPQLSKVKDNYSSIIKSFSDRSKQLLIVTSPPLRPLLTNKTEARLSSNLANWLVAASDNVVKVFDFHHLLSEIDGRHRGMLKREYRRLLPFDNHPNRKAHQAISPMLAEVIDGTDSIARP